MSNTELFSPIRKLLAEEGLEPDPPPERRIFTNRDLNLDRISMVGFDMDYTLAIYRQEEIERLSLLATLDKLIARGYPEALREVDADPRFAIRGLMVDKRLGNVMKMDLIERRSSESGCYGSLLESPLPWTTCGHPQKRCLNFLPSTGAGLPGSLLHG